MKIYRTVSLPVCLLSLTMGMIAHSALAGDRALSLDGTKGYVQVWDSPSLDITDSITISVWFYFQGGIPGIAQPGIVQKDGPDSWGRYGLWTFGDKDKVQFCIFPIAGLPKCLISTRSLIVDSWNHIAGVYDGNTMHLYLDGEMAGSGNLSGPISTSNRRLYIGADPTQDLYMHGIIDEVCIWNTAHTQSNIQATMNIKLTGREVGLVGYWNFDDGTADDLTANGNHGELMGKGNAKIITPGRSWPFAVEPVAKLTTTWATLKR